MTPFWKRFRGEGETFHYVLQATDAFLTGFDNIMRDLLNSGTLRRYINEFSVTGVTFNP